MANKNIAEIMNMNSDDDPDRKQVEDGEWLLRFTSYRPDNVKNEKNTPFVRFNVKPIGKYDAEGNVEEALNYDNVQHDVWMSDDSRPIAKGFFQKSLGIETKGKGWREIYEEAIGLEVRGVIKVQLEGKNKDRPTPRIVKFLNLNT